MTRAHPATHCYNGTYGETNSKRRSRNGTENRNIFCPRYQAPSTPKRDPTIQYQHTPLAASRTFQSIKILFTNEQTNASFPCLAPPCIPHPYRSTAAPLVGNITDNSYDFVSCIKPLVFILLITFMVYPLYGK